MYLWVLRFFRQDSIVAATQGGSKPTPKYFNHCTILTKPQKCDSIFFHLLLYTTHRQGNQQYLFFFFEKIFLVFLRFTNQLFLLNWPLLLPCSHNMNSNTVIIKTHSTYLEFPLQRLWDHKFFAADLTTSSNSLSFSQAFFAPTSIKVKIVMICPSSQLIEKWKAFHRAISRLTTYIKITLS